MRQIEARPGMLNGPHGVAPYKQEDYLRGLPYRIDFLFREADELPIVKVLFSSNQLPGVTWGPNHRLSTIHPSSFSDTNRNAEKTNAALQAAGLTKENS